MTLKEYAAGSDLVLMYWDGAELPKIALTALSNLDKPTLESFINLNGSADADFWTWDGQNQPENPLTRLIAYHLVSPVWTMSPLSTMP